MPSKEQVDGLVTKLETIQKADIRHTELGTVGGFQAAQDLKDAIAGYLLGLLFASRDVIEYVDGATLDQLLEEIRQITQALEVLINELDHLAKGDVHNQQFPVRRDSQVSNLQERWFNFRRAMLPAEALVRVARVERLAGAGPLLEVTRQVEEKIQAADSLLVQATKALDNVQTKAMGKAVDTAAASFNELRHGHARREIRWFCAFLVSAAVVVISVAWVALSDWRSDDMASIVASVIQRLLILSVPALFMRLSLAKYNLERNLRIIYDHRDAVLAQYRTFETAIGDDAPAKNQFRLEIAKYIFSDPVTGYITHEAGAEINVSPIVGMIERVAGGK